MCDITLWCCVVLYKDNVETCCANLWCSFLVGDSSDISNQPVDVNDLPVNGTYLRNQREVKICSPQDAGHLLDAAIASHSAPGGKFLFHFKC